MERPSDGRADQQPGPSEQDPSRPRNQPPTDVNRGAIDRHYARPPCDEILPGTGASAQPATSDDPESRPELLVRDQTRFPNATTRTKSPATARGAMFPMWAI